MNCKLRIEKPDDYRTVEELIREAFWGTHHPGCDEHLLAHRLRKQQSFVPERDHVAEVNGSIVGNVMYSLAEVIADDGGATEVLSIGPLSVLPSLQRQGIGTTLMAHTIGVAGQLGYRGIVFYGHPDYYPRLGFRRATEFGIGTSAGTFVDALMALPLYGNALADVRGRFIEDAVFERDAKEAEDFDKSFPHKEHRNHESTEILRGKLDEAAMSALAEHAVLLLPDLDRYSGSEIASWQGITEKAYPVLNAILREHGHAGKTWP